MREFDLAPDPREFPDLLAPATVPPPPVVEPVAVPVEPIQAAPVAVHAVPVPERPWAELSAWERSARRQEAAQRARNARFLEGLSAYQARRETGPPMSLPQRQRESLPPFVRQRVGGGGNDVPSSL